jgi:hypothetical protein
VEKYSLHFEPEIPANSKMINRITKLAASSIREKLSIFIPHGICIYSKTKLLDDIECKVENDGQ